MLPPGARLGALLLTLSFVALLASAPAAAEEPLAKPMVVEVQLFEFGVEPWGLSASPGKNVSFHIVNVGKIPHNLWVGDTGEVAKWDPALEGGQDAWLNFTVPASGRIPYWCAIPGHRELGMEANLTVFGTVQPGGGAEAGPGAQIEAIHKLGVNYLAYWVGVISFIVLFVVLAATFFLLRYGESRHWTDQKERPVRKEEAPAKSPTGTWIALGLVLVVFVVAAVQVVRMV